jgi:hypothetical protein
MKRYVVSMAAGLLAFVMGYCVAAAADVPGALSSEGPALAGFEGRTVVAWAGLAGVSDHAVWYTNLDGNQTQIPNAQTLFAPALAVAGQRLYLAATPPADDDKIRLYGWDGSAFQTTGEDLCDGLTCAHTRASPALLGDGAMLYAAWSTRTGEIRYASMINGVWSIAPLPIPNATTSSTTGPTLALFQNQIFVAWVEPSGDAVSVAVGTLPLTSSSWSERRKIPAHTHVAPALGVLAVATASNPNESNALFVSWTTLQSTINFARWDSSTTQWVPADSPFPLASGPLTSSAPALNGFTTMSPNDVCFFTNNLAYTVEDTHKIENKSKQTRQGCPGPAP